jgi:hypothetical protein
MLIARPYAEHDREDQWMPNLPIVIVLTAVLKDTSLDDPVTEDVEPRLDVPSRIMSRRRLTALAPDARQVMAVQPFEVVGIDTVLHDLKPVAGQDRLADIAQAIFPHEEVISGQKGSRFGAKVGENEPTELLHAIGRRPHPMKKPRVRRLGRHFEAPPGRVKFPAVVRTPDPLVVDHAVGERRPAMGTMFIEKAQSTGRVAE